MALLAELKRRARHVVGPVAGCLLVGYFSYHAVEGDRGVRAYLQLERQIVEAQSRGDALSAERAALEDRVARLSPSSLDTDLLEERARIVLGYVPADGLVVGAGPAVSEHGRTQVVGLAMPGTRAH